MSPEERINNICRSFAWYRWQHEVAQAKEAGVPVLQVHYLFFTMPNVLHDVTCVLVTIFPILGWSCTQKWLKAQAFALFWRKQRQTCLQLSSSNIVCCNLIRTLLSLQHAARAIIVASIVDRAVSGCSFDCHKTGQFAKVMMNPVQLLAQIGSIYSSWPYISAKSASR